MEESAEETTAKVRLRNTGDRPGREVVQLYLAPGESAEATVELPRRAFEIWDEATGSWSYVKGSYEIQVGRSITDRSITATINV